MDVGPTPKRFSKEIPEVKPSSPNKAQMGGMSLTGGAGNYGPTRAVNGAQGSRSRSGSTSTSSSSGLGPKPKPQQDKPISPQETRDQISEDDPIQRMRAAVTGSSTRSRRSTGPQEPEHLNSGSQNQSDVASPIPPSHRPPLPSIPPSPPTSEQTIRAPLPDVPRLPKAASADDLEDFSKAFPSLSEFGKQFEEFPEPNSAFARDPDSIDGLPNDHPRPRSDTILEEEDGPMLSLPDVSNLPDLPSLPSVPTTRPGGPRAENLKSLDRESMGPPSPDPTANLKRPASTANVTTISPSSPNPTGDSTRSPLSNGISSPPASGTPQVQTPIAFPVAQPTPGPSMSKPKFPFSSSVDPETLRSYILNDAVDLLLLDVRPEEEFQTGYVGVEYEPRGAKIKVVWLDPTVVLRDGWVRSLNAMLMIQDDLGQAGRRFISTAGETAKGIREPTSIRSGRSVRLAFGQLAAQRYRQSSAPRQALGTDLRARVCQKARTDTSALDQGICRLGRVYQDACGKTRPGVRPGQWVQPPETGDKRSWPATTVSRCAAIDADI